MPLESDIRALLDAIPEEIVPGCACVVRRNRETVFRHMRGYADYERTRPVSQDDLYYVYSCTKVVTCTAALRLVERGKLGLDDPVSSYLPEYARMTVADAQGVRPAAVPIRVRDLFSMTSGLSYDLTTGAVRTIRENPAAGTRAGAALLANEPLLFEPGADFRYSLSHDVLAAVAEVASGLPFDAFVRAEILDPLGMEHTGFSPRTDKTHRLSAQYWLDMERLCAVPFGMENEFVFNSAYCSGGAGLVSTADDMIVFTDALCNGGTAENGWRLLRPETIDLMRRDRLSAAARASFVRDWPVLRNYSYGLGVRTFVENADGFGGTPGEFGWEGAAGSYLLIDPAHRLSIFYAQHVRNSAWVCEHVHRELRKAVYDAIGA